MTHRSIVWIVYSVLFANWWIAAIYAAWRVPRDPNWRPPLCRRFPQTFGVEISGRAYVRLCFFGAVAGTLGAFWFPALFIEIVEHRQ
jgi:hypothetical protein